ncbi:MAG: hypothetical protein ACI4VF_00660 [Lachnospirales bacterium]
MATKSMLKDIEIKNKNLGSSFAHALDAALANSANVKNNEPMKRECMELTGADVKNFFSF